MLHSIKYLSLIHIFNELPYKFEAGTPNADGAVSLHAAIDYLESFGMDAIEAYEEELVAYILPKIVALPHVHVIGSQNPKEKHGVIAFTVDDVHPHDVATILDSKGICVRSGHHCAQPLGAFYNVSASTRLSMYLSLIHIYNPNELGTLCSLFH